MIRQTRIITVANQKGGVGKTTTTMNLGVALTKAGKKVLLVDGDPQGNLTSYLGVTPGVPPYENIRTLDEIYLAKRALDADSRRQFIASTNSGVDLISADRSLSGVEYYLFSRGDKEMVLNQFFAGVAPHYDFIFIDTPPSLNLLTLNALCASDHVLIPVQPEFFSLEGIVKVRQAIDDVKLRWNDRLSILGLLLTQLTLRRKLTQEVVDALRAEFGTTLFETMIFENSAVAESSGHSQSVIDYDRSSRGAKNYVSAAQELLRRCGLEVSSKKSAASAEVGR